MSYDDIFALPISHTSSAALAADKANVVIRLADAEDFFKDVYAGQGF